MRSIHSLLLALAAASAAPAWSQNVISDDFTQAVSNNSWYFFNGACLTAGTGTSVRGPCRDAPRFSETITPTPPSRR